MKLIYTAAHGGFAGQPVPLGGGAAVCDQLVAEWTRTRPFDFELLTPSILGRRAPTARDIVRFNEREYARFCVEFSAAATREILRHDPADTVVLSNDISEGPDFERLAAAGFAVSVIYHVDVAAYISAIYLRDWIAPETLVRWHARLPRWASPRIVRLIFEKQRQTAVHARRLIVPSPEMKCVLGRCYGRAAEAKTEVVPWGVTPVDPDPQAGAALRREFGVPDDAAVLLTLSRISPEKGQDLLLEALKGWPGPTLWLFICGEPAYMQGARFAAKLERLARRLDNVRVAFPGYVTGERKRAFFSMADIYVFPSRHESYGLTLLEALSAGLPCICADHHGARAVMRPGFGEMVPPDPQSLRGAVERLAGDSSLRTRMGSAARAWAVTQKFSSAAERLAAMLTESAGTAPRPRRAVPAPDPDPRTTPSPTHRPGSRAEPPR